MSETVAGRITLLVRLMQQHLTEQEAHETSAKDAKKLADAIAREDLPELLREAEVKELKLEDGTKVKLTENAIVSIIAAKKPEAHAWLEAGGFGGLIKTQVTVAFDAADREEAVKLATELQEKFPGAVEVSADIHASTLKAFVKEQLEEGKTFPEDLFSVFPYSEAKITAPRSR